jgi:hypothetical protein
MIRLAEPQVRIRMGQAGRKRVQEVFDWELKETLYLICMKKFCLSQLL